MTQPAPPLAPPRTAPVRAAVGAGAIAALGCAVLAARPALLASAREPERVLLAVFAALLAVGLAVPLPQSAPAHRVRARPPFTTAAATVLGLTAFAAGRLLIGGRAPDRFTLYAVAVNALAAVAEEVWFRRLCYGLLEPAGAGFAIAATSVLFALVHVSTYGWSVVPLDLAAGAILGWQRATTGSWHASAITHVLANVFVLL